MNLLFGIPISALRILDNHANIQKHDFFKCINDKKISLAKATIARNKI
jgi:hypothetical protein